MKVPYIGVTGFTDFQQVKTALDFFPEKIDRKLMVGILASWKSLRGIPMREKWQKQTPFLSQLRAIFSSDSRALNLVHYSADKKNSNDLLCDLKLIHRSAGENFHGFQLNLVWPNPEVLDEYRQGLGRNLRIILQVGSQAMKSVGNNPSELAKSIKPYANLVDDILIDPSGGQGKLFDPSQAQSFLIAIQENIPEIGLGVAGGLSVDTIHLVEPLLVTFPNLSIDAQGRLRDRENNLDTSQVVAYLTRATRIFQ